MVIVLTAKYVDMQCNTRRDGERIEDVGNHLRREVADFFSFQTETRKTVRTRADIDDRSG